MPVIVVVSLGSTNPPGRVTPRVTGAVKVPDGPVAPADAVIGAGTLSTTVPTVGGFAGRANPQSSSAAAWR